VPIIFASSEVGSIIGSDVACLLPCGSRCGSVQSALGALGLEVNR
jgi:hypothetical protein